ncbi:MAG: type II toxin-antitoxin system PemK/MazF family toxin [Chitinophagaceae bacterium]|nr:type II toxin-antitoxin system PemK/MazF family toxin [Chitinophagaceae bacterium]
MAAIRKYDIWIADLNPQRGTEPGKKRPVVVIQTDFLNQTHLSTIICPVTTNVVRSSKILRIHIPKNTCGMPKDSDILIDQVRAIDNTRFLRKAGTLTNTLRKQLNENLKIVLDLD